MQDAKSKLQVKKNEQKIKSLLLCRLARGVCMINKKT